MQEGMLFNSELPFSLEHNLFSTPVREGQYLRSRPHHCTILTISRNTTASPSSCLAPWAQPEFDVVGHSPNLRVEKHCIRRGVRSPALGGSGSGIHWLQGDR